MPTQYFSWRRTFYVNPVFAAVAAAGAVTYIRSGRPAVPPADDWPGTVLASAGLFLIVFGFSHAETVGWAAALTIGSLALGVFLFLTYYLQVVKGYSPLPTGLLFLPSWPASWSAPMPPASSPCRGSGRVS